jgi:hypothetical protein
VVKLFALMMCQINFCVLYESLPISSIYACSRACAYVQANKDATSALQYATRREEEKEEAVEELRMAEV